MSQRPEVSSLVGLVAPLDGPARRSARHCHGSPHGEQVIAALRHVRRRIGRPLLVVWDWPHAHRATKVLECVAAHPDDDQIEWLPPCAPELNPEELCHGWVTRDMQNALPGSVGELRSLARRSLLRLGHQSDLLHHLFCHAGLRVH